MIQIKCQKRTYTTFTEGLQPDTVECHQSNVEFKRESTGLLSHPRMSDAALSCQPAMRPSATQLLQYERLALITKVVEAEKMFVPPTVSYCAC